jgi:hypothetical protein
MFYISSDKVSENAADEDALLWRILGSGKNGKE